jgi:nucleotidyltransferase/DNA polymerase involved in DNA repair
VAEFDGLHVEGADGHRIGDVDGFIVDAEARRVNYIVVDSGGWFTSRRLLLPIGHAATIAPDRKSLRADVSREALRLLPEFDEDRFRAFTDDELRAFERNTVVCCCPDEPLEDVSIAVWGYESRRHYAQPAWWRIGARAAERLQPVTRDYRAAGGGVPAEAPGAPDDPISRAAVT